MRIHRPVQAMNRILYLKHSSRDFVSRQDFDTLNNQLEEKF